MNTRKSCLYPGLWNFDIVPNLDPQDWCQSTQSCPESKRNHLQKRFLKKQQLTAVIKNATIISNNLVYYMFHA